MSRSTAALDAFTARLGFAVDDYDAANDAFRRWKASRRDADRDAVQMWAYAYIQRYFLARFATERAAGASDLDAAVTRAFTRTLNALDRIEDRFASYVSVVCVNVLRNHRRDRKVTTEVMEDTATVREREAADYDRALMRRVLLAAVATLPDAIRDIGRMRWIEGQDYDAIAEATGRPIATCRTYAAKARTRLAQHPDLRALHFEDVLPPTATPPDGLDPSLRRV